jgi:ferric-dicitrate binding protein FerR (iron transport regulator)
MAVLHTPKKGKYRLLLADGSKVWLNSLSSLQFAPAFSTLERRVKISGEAFFEIAKDVKRPFIVEVAGNEVRAIGTKFNIKAYANDSHVTVTLVEGAVSVNNHQLAVNQQVQLQTAETTVREVDAAAISAWKENQFVFADATIEEIMKEVERWYGAVVVYEHKPPYHFNASISRGAPVSKLLNILGRTGQVQFDIRSDTIIVK